MQKLTLRELRYKEQELKNLIEINDEQLEGFDKKMNTTGLNKEEDQTFLKLIFAGMELESKLEPIKTKIKVLQTVARWRLNRAGIG